MAKNSLGARESMPQPEPTGLEPQIEPQEVEIEAQEGVESATTPPQTYTELDAKIADLAQTVGLEKADLSKPASGIEIPEDHLGSVNEDLVKNAKDLRDSTNNSIAILMLGKKSFAKSEKGKELSKEEQEALAFYQNKEAGDSQLKNVRVARKEAQKLLDVIDASQYRQKAETPVVEDVPTKEPVAKAPATEVEPTVIQEESVEEADEETADEESEPIQDISREDARGVALGLLDEIQGLQTELEGTSRFRVFKRRALNKEIESKFGDLSKVLGTVEGAVLLDKKKTEGDTSPEAVAKSKQAEGIVTYLADVVSHIQSDKSRKAEELRGELEQALSDADALAIETKKEDSGQQYSEGGVAAGSKKTLRTKGDQVVEGTTDEFFDKDVQKVLKKQRGEEVEEEEVTTHTDTSAQEQAYDEFVERGKPKKKAKKGSKKKTLATAAGVAAASFAVGAGVANMENEAGKDDAMPKAELVKASEEASVGGMSMEVKPGQSIRSSRFDDLLGGMSVNMDFGEGMTVADLEKLPEEDKQRVESFVEEEIKHIGEDTGSAEQAPEEGQDGLTGEYNEKRAQLIVLMSILHGYESEKVGDKIDYKVEEKKQNLQDRIEKLEEELALLDSQMSRFSPEMVSVEEQEAEKERVLKVALAEYDEAGTEALDVADEATERMDAQDAENLKIHGQKMLELRVKHDADVRRIAKGIMAKPEFKKRYEDQRVKAMKLGEQARQADKAFDEEGLSDEEKAKRKEKKMKLYAEFFIASKLLDGMEEDARAKAESELASDYAAQQGDIDRVYGGALPIPGTDLHAVVDKSPKDRKKATKYVAKKGGGVEKVQ